jgi:hypothetical protein
MVMRIVRWITDLVRRAAGAIWLHDSVQQLQQQVQAHAGQLTALRQQQEGLDAGTTWLRDSVAHLPQQAPAQATELTAVNSKTPVAGAAPEVRVGALHTVLPEKRFRVMFVFQHPAVWLSWRSVIRACMADARFDLQVVLTPFNHPTGGLLAQDSARELLIRERIPFFVAGHIDVRKTRPHVVFLQNPYDETRPAALQSAALDAIGCRVAYIPYGLEIGGGAANLRVQFDLDVHRLAWRIYARSERHRRMFARHCASGSGHVRVTGHPKLDTTAAAATPWVDQLRTKVAGRRVLLWTPHFSVGPEAGWSTFERYGQTIIEHIAQRPHLFLLVRPHPMFFSSMRLNGLWSAAQVAEFKERLREANNMELDEQPEYCGAFAVASALLADAGSFLLEFLPTGKPIVYLHRVDGPGLSEEGEVIDNYVVVRSAGELPDVIDRLGSGKDPQREMRLAAVQEFLHLQDGRAGERICQDIANSLASGSQTWLRAREQDDASLASQEFWAAASNSYLAVPSYYDRKAHTLNHWLEQSRPSGSLLDIGCSDGRYSAQASAHFTSLLGYDLSPALIEQAKKRTDIALSCQAKFIVADLETFNAAGTYDCVFCMGVTSCLPSYTAYLRLLDRLAMITRPGGDLVLVDTVAVGSVVRARSDNGYVATYRNEDEYHSSTVRRGFTRLHVDELARDTERHLVNRFCVYRRNDA